MSFLHHGKTVAESNELLDISQKYAQGFLFDLQLRKTDQSAVICLSSFCLFSLDTPLEPRSLLKCATTGQSGFNPNTISFLPPPSISLMPAPWSFFGSWPEIWASMIKPSFVFTSPWYLSLV